MRLQVPIRPIDVISSIRTAGPILPFSFVLLRYGWHHRKSRPLKVDQQDVILGRGLTKNKSKRTERIKARHFMFMILNLSSATSSNMPSGNIDETVAPTSLQLTQSSRLIMLIPTLIVSKHVNVIGIIWSVKLKTTNKKHLNFDVHNRGTVAFHKTSSVAAVLFICA